MRWYFQLWSFRSPWYRHQSHHLRRSPHAPPHWAGAYLACVNLLKSIDALCNVHNFLEKIKRKPMTMFHQNESRFDNSVKDLILLKFQLEKISNKYDICRNYALTSSQSRKLSIRNSTWPTTSWSTTRRIPTENPKHFSVSSNSSITMPEAYIHMLTAIILA